MSRIRGRDTGPELAIRKALWSRRLRYRLHYPIPGRPDVVFPRQKVAVFIDGCFWHGCRLHGVRPRTNSVFWSTKIRKNRARDRKVARLLSAEGWSILRFWEHEVEADTERVASQIAKAVKGAANRHGQRTRG